MAPAGVVEGLDPLEDRRPEIGPGGPALPVEQFALHAGPERLDHAVVDAGGDPPHRAEQAGGAQPVAEDPGRVLTAVAVDDCAGSGPAAPAGQLEGVNDQLRADRKSVV